MRWVASVNRSRPWRVREYSLWRPERRALEPPILRQPPDGGAHQPLRQPEGLRKPDQAAQRHRAAARHDRIPEDRDDQRATAQRTLPPEAREQGVYRLIELWPATCRRL